MLDQSLQPHEIIIIDDASSDSSKDIITGFKSRYPDIIKTIFNERNHGISKTRNVAISHCSGDIITFVDADDYYFPRKIEIEMKKLKGGNYGCVYSNHVFINEFGHENGLFSNDGDQPAEGNIFKENFSRSFRVSSGANFHNEMLYKSCAQDIGLYDDKIMATMLFYPLLLTYFASDSLPTLFATLMYSYTPMLLVINVGIILIFLE